MVSKLDYGPSTGALDAESPKSKQNNEQIFWVTKYVFCLQICNMFCIHEAVTISNHSRVLPSTVGLLHDLKTSKVFLHFPTFTFSDYLLEPIW